MYRKWCLVFLIFGFLINSNSFADTQFFKNHETSIMLIPYCYHFNRPEKNKSINENPQGIDIDIDGWEFITFNNSFNDQSYFIGKISSTKKWNPFKNDIFGRLSLRYGLLYGYKDEFPNIYGVTMGIMPSLEIGYKKVSIESGISPYLVALAFKYYF